MREIKFRAWDIRENRMMRFGEFWACDEYQSLAWRINDDDKTINEGDYCLDWSESVIVEQFTGLQDKNGVDIYEGDVVKYKLDGITARTEQVRHVKYIQDAFECVLNKYADPLPIRWAFEIEVIGNIHENKELLEGEKS